MMCAALLHPLDPKLKLSTQPDGAFVVKPLNSLVTCSEEKGALHSAE